MSRPECQHRQRSALAECALRVLGASDTLSMSEAATSAVAEGLDGASVAVFERKSYGLDRLAATGWPLPGGRSAEPPPGALRALNRSVPVRFESAGGNGMAVHVEDAPARLLVAVADSSFDPTDDDGVFLREIAAILRSGYARLRTERALRESEGRARESEARAHAILDTTVDGILTIDTEGRIQSFNPAAERIFGYRAAEIVGENVSVLMPPPYRERHDRYIEAYLETGVRRVIGAGREVIGQRRDGTTFPMEVSISEVVLPDLRLFTGIVRDITERRELEREVVRVMEDERRLLGQELHDELGQQLSGIRLLAQDLARRLDAVLDADLSADVHEIAALIRTADKKARGLSRGLILADVRADDLPNALEQMARNGGRLFQVSTAFESSGTPTDLSDTTATHLFRIAQEALTNAARHGRPSEIKVRLDWLPKELRLTVADNGSGIPGLQTTPTFHPPIVPEGQQGIGIKTMIYRAHLMGGSLSLAVSAEGGVRITCGVPYAYVAPDHLDLGSL